MPITVISMNLLLGLALVKRKYSKLSICQSAKTSSLSNNSSVVCDIFNQNLCIRGECKKSHKCR